LVNPIAKCFSPLPPGQSAFAIPQKNSTDRNSCLCAIPPGVIATLAPIRKLLKILCYILWSAQFLVGKAANFGKIGRFAKPAIIGR
jgi:hypothetical protein